LQFDDLAAKTCIGKKCGGIECVPSVFDIQNRPFWTSAPV
jgi:hypothetical protein